MVQIDIQKLNDAIMLYLEEEIPNELKAHRISMDIVIPILEKIRSEYEWASLVSRDKGH